MIGRLRLRLAGARRRRLQQQIEVEAMAVMRLTILDRLKTRPDAYWSTSELQLAVARPSAEITEALERLACEGYVFLCPRNVSVLETKADLSSHSIHLSPVGMAHRPHLNRCRQAELLVPLGWIG
jgi:hypothetical protein